jgi:rare lipoprotein A
VTRFFVACEYAERHLVGIFRHLWPGRRASAGVWYAVPGFVSGETGFQVSQNVSALLLAATAILLLLAGCGNTPRKAEPRVPTHSKPGGYYLDDGPGDHPPPNLDAIADATPRAEPLHRGANRPYTIFGKTYVPNVSSEPFRQQGMASWYGRKFHGNMTSIGETYDMYAMTAAHPTLPLPAYVRITNPANMKTVVLRVNDRGPFHSDRIIDLSYAAAAKLDLARKGSGMVIVERVFPGETRLSALPAAPLSQPSVAPPALPTITTQAIVPEAGDLYLQLAAFSSAENAEIFHARISRELEWNREPIQVIQKDNLFRVRMGPYKTRDEAEAIAAQVRQSHDFSPVIQKP